MKDISESMQLFLTTEQELLTQIKHGLGSSQNRVSLVNSTVLAIQLETKDLQNLVWSICDFIPQGRWGSVRCCTEPSNQQPTHGQLMRSESLDLVRKKVDAVWLEEIIREGRLITYFQPIVSNQTPYKVFAYECLIRGVSKDQQLIAPRQLFSAARGSGKMGQLDHAARLKCIETAKTLNIGVNIFIKLNPNFISDSLHDLAETMEAVVESRVDPNRFVFEVVESEEISDVGKLHQILNYCRKTGCRVALDDVGAGYNSLNNLPEVLPDFIKLGMELARDVHKDYYKSRIAGKLLELARELKLGAIMEGIETLETWNWVREHGADYSQGFLFAKPAAIPPRPKISPKICPKIPSNRSTLSSSQP
jgi:EAL domain-containing protein (putative c-di-GMP-specific phosphodiesterase class I)